MNENAKCFWDYLLFALVLAACVWSLFQITPHP